MSNFSEKKLDDFSAPTKLPGAPEEAEVWQERNRSWWETNPMRYDWRTAIPHEPFSRGFYKEVDKRFFSNAREYLSPNIPIPFGEFIPFDSLKDKDVLEVGVGMGSHAELLASHAKTFTGIDLTDYAAQNTAARLKLLGRAADVRKVDAEHMPFPDESFDFVWSWGVVHHSSNTGNVVREIHRVLRPGGTAVFMVYHRGWWNYYIVGALRSVLTGKLFKTRSLAKSIQSFTDGALARYYTISEWRALTAPLFLEKKIEVRGPCADLILLPGGRLKDAALRRFPLSLNRFLTGALHMGVFLVSTLSKR